MPDDVRAYFTQTIQQVADFFNVRPGDILGILKAENNGAGFRLYQPAVSTAGAVGVAQIVPRTWNGWANPITDRHLPSLLDIERHGGIGFDWDARDAWSAWKKGDLPDDAIADTHADPMQFEDAVAAVARHLAQWGLTRDAARDNPVWFQKRLADAVAVYNSGRTLSQSADWRQSSANPKTVAQYVAEAVQTAAATPDTLAVQPAATTAPLDALTDAYTRAYTQAFGAPPADARRRVAQNAMLLADLAAGKRTLDEAAAILLNEDEAHFIAEARAAEAAGRPLPWPYARNTEELAIQKLATRILGHPLTADELHALAAVAQGDLTRAAESLRARGDAAVVAEVQARMADILQREVALTEAAALVQPLLHGLDPWRLDAATRQALVVQAEARLRTTDEYRRLYGEPRFTAFPMHPMPRIFKPFGVPVDYQVGGKHTGIDVALPPTADGRQPTLYAVADGTVVHVGPLYCNQPDQCRGGHAIVIDHGDNVYSLYSHNSAAFVQVGDRVQAGQPIGRQGDEGYSFGSHLHFEVHVGGPFTGNWRQPFTQGAFVDPTDWLPPR
ncbi:hypothetical protein ARMA_2318 [Ardenticatena maritima]|uniref:M23ase beta-sheet core domain-containing protein n=4 Tax=Ardenticatena maritima TaxID=872965 RepID=A0A0M8K8F8_9CHLR|nr:peptidoglycan DD-metalloendopeptidase family protein [Ardenticatena maritima]GAP63895.1 hypothetical protein ARMA_2318 [Ardenticatena maritima]